MSKPLSNLDYLLGTQKAPPAQNAPDSSGQSSIDEAAVALGTPVLSALYRSPQGQQTTFQLVDTLDVSLRDLSPVLDVLSSDRFRWIEIDRSDRKGNYQITLTPRGRDYISDYMRKMGGNRAL
jgi:hypothetical protein